jgi:hypothetical protein
LGWRILKSPSKTLLVEALEREIETKEKFLWESSGRASSGGQFSDKVEGRLMVL